MSLPVWVPGLVKYGICDRQHQNSDRAFVAMFGLTSVHFGGVKMWQLSVISILSIDISFPQADYGPNTIPERLV